MKTRWLGLVVTACAASAAMACSGPGAQAAMIWAEAYGKIGFGVNAILSIFAFSCFRSAKRGPGHPAILALLLICHPTIFVSAYSGDCGSGLEAATTLSFGLMLGLLMWQAAVMASVRKR